MTLVNSNFTRVCYFIKHLIVLYHPEIEKPESPEKPRIRELDALRGIAALSVVLFHFAMPWQTHAIPFLGVFSMGVDLFFIISGFVIFMTIEKSNDWKDFAWNRFARLYPAYWVCVTITIMLIVIKYKFLVPAESYRISHNLWMQYLANMTMFQYYFGAANIDGPYWTLIIELCFYLTMILLFITRKLAHITLIGWSFTLFCASYALPGVFNNVWLHKVLIAFPLIGYFPFFYAGMMLYKMKFGEVTPLRLMAFITTLIFQCLMFGNCYENRNFVNIYQYSAMLTVIYGVLLAFLFGRLSFIVSPVTMWLGRISYSLYLIHQYVGIRILIPQAIEHLQISFWVAAPIALAAVLTLAHLINKYVEVPALHYLKGKYRISQALDTNTD